MTEPTPDSPPPSSYHANPLAAQSLYARLQKLGEDIQLQHEIITAQKEVVKKTRQRSLVNPKKEYPVVEPHLVHAHAGTVLRHRAMLIKHYEIIQQHKEMVKEQGKHVQNLTSTLLNIQQETYVVDELMNTKMAESTSRRATPTPTSPFLPPLAINYENPLPDITAKPKQIPTSTKRINTPNNSNNKTNPIKVGKHETDTIITSNHHHNHAASPDVTNDDDDIYIITTESNNTSNSPDTSNDQEPPEEPPSSDQPFVTTTTTITTTTPNSTSTTTISSVTTQTPTSTTTTTSSTTTTMSSLPTSLPTSLSPSSKENFEHNAPLPLSP